MGCDSENASNKARRAYVALKDTLLFNLVYCSRARTGVKEAQVDAIIATSRRRNPVLGITGLLVFGSGCSFSGLRARRPRS